MQLIKIVGKRQEGMGLKLFKFHAITHIATDIMYFGVPLEVDTGCNESGHKESKAAANLTQRREDTFDAQVAQRKEEMHLLSLALQEMEGRPLWCYGQRIYHTVPEINNEATVPETNNTTGGAKIMCFKGANGQPKCKYKTRCKAQFDAEIEVCLIEFVIGLQELFPKLYPDGVMLRSEHTRDGTIFRGNASYQGKVWRDWVLIDWSSDGELPCKIWGFVDLTDIQGPTGLSYGGLDEIEGNVYAIVEAGFYVNAPQGAPTSTIFSPIKKEVGAWQGQKVSKLQFYLADVDAFVAPLTVVPDIGGKPNDYFAVKNCSAWREAFVSWLEEPNEDYPLDSDSDDDTQD